MKRTVIISDLQKKCNKCGYVGEDFSPGKGRVCRPCRNAYARERYQDPDISASVRETQARWRAANPEVDVNRRLVREFGITLAEYDEMFDAQAGVCALCGKPESLNRRLAVDHCHDTGQVRGLLCFKCNTAIGALGDNEAAIAAAIIYLTDGAA